MTDTVSMTKGDVVNLSKKSASLNAVFAGAGWDVKNEGKTMDLDLAAFLLSNGTLKGKGNFVYFGSKTSACGSVSSRGDNLDGKGEGDDEVIDVNLKTVPADVNEILFIASIYQAASKGQSIKDLDNAFIRIVNKDDNVELANFKISIPDATGASFVLGKLVRNGEEWEFTAIGEVDAAELGGFAERFGLRAAA